MKRLSIFMTCCFALALAGTAFADIPVAEVEPNDDCSMVQEVGDFVSGDPFVVSGSMDPEIDLDDFYGASAGTGIVTITLDCTDDLDLYVGFCDGDTFNLVAASATYDCPEVISGYFLEAADWELWVEGSYAAGPSDYTITALFEACPDADADGYLDMTCGGSDCDDTDADINPGADEICDDLIDNDCDELIDDADEECACDTPDAVIECGDTVTGTTIGGENALDAYLSCTILPETGPEVIYTLTTTADGPLAVTLSGLSADLDLFLLEDDGGEACATSCLDYSAGIADETIEIDALPAGTYHIVVDGYSGAESDFTLAVECGVPFILDLIAGYAEGRLAMDFLVGTPAEAYWGVYLILTTPSVVVRPLWMVPLPVIDPPIEYLLSFPFPAVGPVGLYTGLFTTTGGAEAIDLVWVDTGTP